MLLFVIPVTIVQLKRMTPAERSGMKQIKLWLMVIVGGIAVSLWTGIAPLIFFLINKVLGPLQSHSPHLPEHIS